MTKNAASVHCYPGILLAPKEHLSSGFGDFSGHPTRRNPKNQCEFIL